MQLSPEYIKDIEIKYLRVLISALEKDEMSIQEAKDSARDFLALLPFSDHTDMKSKIENYVKQYPFLVELHVFILQKEEDGKTQGVLEKMRDLMKNDDIDGALSLVQS